jgi:hypothetical protein
MKLICGPASEGLFFAGFLLQIGCHYFAAIGVSQKSCFKAQSYYLILHAEGSI